MTGDTERSTPDRRAPPRRPGADGQEDARSASSERSSPRDWLPAALVAFVAVVSLGAAQGGYFPTSWGPSVAVASAIVILWLAIGSPTDAGWRDGALIACLALFAVWVGLSTIWSASPAQSVLEFQRVLVLLTGVSAVLILALRTGATSLVFAVMAGITGIAGYSLATRLAPGRISTFDPDDGYRLAGSIGYWNGLGTFAAMGVVLAVGIGIGGQIRWQRLSASAALVVLASTLFFTFSRGAAVALVCGLAAMLAITPRRVRTLGALALLAPAPVVAVLAASRSKGLTYETPTLVDASTDGRALALLLAALAALAVGAAALLIFLESRISISRRSRRGFGALALAVVVIAALTVIFRAGGPADLAHRARLGFDRPSQPSSDDLNEHLFTLSGSGRADLWRVALSAYQEHPVLGIGAGTFERYWQKDARATHTARDAHSLYLETLTELGPIGLALLLAAGAMIVSGAVASRRNPIVPGTLGAFTVYAVHAGVEWDWELTGVTLTAFLAGITGLVALRRPRTRQLRIPARVGLGALVAGVGLISALGYVGNEALAQSRQALDREDARHALQKADIARRWAPWSPYPLTARGEALLQLGELKGANTAFRDAIEADAGYWRAWLGLAVASTGRTREQALEHASTLYRNSEEIYRTVLLLRKTKT